MLVMIISAFIVLGAWFYINSIGEQRVNQKTSSLINNQPEILPSIASKNEFVPHTLSTESIYSENHAWVEKLPKERIRVLIATGDIIPARSVNFESLRHKDFNWPYLKSYQLTRDGDITFSNLESPQIKNCPLTNEGMIFCGDYRNIEGLKFAGIDVVSLANNHAGNYGERGVLETFEHLKLNGIDATGAAFSNLVIKDVRGVKFAFLGYNDITKPQPGISNVDEEKIRQEIIDAKKQADIVIVAFHWGAEYRDQPDERQKALGRLAIDAGADLVIGNHPHWIQPIEIYKDKLITYAHGNFVFDQMWSQKTREGVIGKYFFYDNQLIDVEYFPVQIDSYGQPSFSSDVKRAAILDDMRRKSIK